MQFHFDKINECRYMSTNSPIVELIVKCESNEKAGEMKKLSIYVTSVYIIKINN